MESYLTELEKLWKANKKESRNRFDDRPAGLRGPDFMNELFRLALITNDERFVDAMRAIVEYKFVDQNWNFTRWVPVELADRDKENDRIKVAEIDTAVRDRGMSVRKAVAVVAAKVGEPAASFGAACKRLETLYQASRKTVQRDRKTMLLKTKKNGAHQNSRKNGAHHFSNDSK
jgi:hypothetical protein